ncbi:hypothetical protein PUN4_780048 [Paraburkholderia unamae]|nr:hypothetical protein PUN4_780048 [Paraburkholderia unamae]
MSNAGITRPHVSLESVHNRVRYGTLNIIASVFDFVRITMQ